MTDAEADELRAAHIRGMTEVGQVVRRLQAARVSSQSIAAAVGRRPSWVSKHWPTRGQ